MVKKSSPNKKTIPKKPVKAAVVKKNTDGTRIKKLTRRQTKHQSKAAQKQIKLPNAWVLLGRSLRHLWHNKKLFGGILLVYGIFYILFVKGISANFQLGDLRQSLEETFGGDLGTFESSLALYSLLLGSASSTNDQTGSVYQSFFIVIASLALINALRQTYSSTKKLKVKDSFYNSTYPLIPFLCVLGFIIIQFIPALLATSVYGIITNNGLAVGFTQQALTLLVLLMGLFWTFYLVSSSVFALYIVTLPGARPWASLKAAKKLVRFRRWMILRKVSILPIVLMLFSAAVLIPLIIVLPIAAEILFIIFTVSLLGVVHSYLYTLYRNLL